MPHIFSNHLVPHRDAVLLKIKHIVLRKSEECDVPIDWDVNILSKLFSSGSVHKFTGVGGVLGVEGTVAPFRLKQDWLSGQDIGTNIEAIWWCELVGESGKIVGNYLG